MKTRGLKISWPLVWFIAAVVCFMVEWWAFRDSIYSDQPSAVGTLLKGLAEGALLLSWYWLLPSRYRGWLQAALWASGMLFLANALYFRVFNDIIPLSSVTMTDNFNTLFFRSSLALVKWSDSIFLLAPLCLSLTYIFFFKKRVKNQILTWRTKIVAIIACFLIWSIQQFIYINTDRKNIFVASLLETGERGVNWKDATYYQFFFFSANIPNRVSDLHSRGLAVYTVREIYRSLIGHSSTSKIDLTQQQKETIENYLSSQPEQYPLPEAFADRDSMNVVLIIVESLNSWVFDLKVNGEEVTPNLNKLIKEPTTVFISDVVKETRDGG